jgi:oligopeptide/dipeptide ABC transporter ATP-binding protein
VVSSLLEVRGLTTQFVGSRGAVRVVDEVDFDLSPGETLGIVGESGCGKSMTCQSILRLVPYPGKVVAGSVSLDGVDLLRKSEQEMRRVRGRHISMILQDPISSLNPAYTIGKQIAEAIQIHQGLTGQSLREKVVNMLSLVRIAFPEMRADDYPHMFSGGMRQRVAGAIALACQPRLLIADEPTTSLDVTTQAVYLQLLKDLQRENGFAMIFITHDFGIVARICDRVAVMYAGRIVESAPVRKIFNHPCHPYTRALLESVPKADRQVERLPAIPGQPPAADERYSGCAFKPRCPNGINCSGESFPPETKVGQEHTVRCWKHG